MSYTRRALFVIASVTLATSGCRDEKKPGDVADGFSVGEVEDSVSLRVEPNMLTEGTSADGHFHILIPAGAVDAPTDIAIGRLKASERPAGALGDIYVLAPIGMTFNKPVRLRFDFQASTDPDAVRPVQFDTGAKSYDVLKDWVYVHSASLLAGSTSHFSAYGPADASASTLTNDSPEASEGDELLSAHHLAAARDAYEAAVDADPNDLGAHFGAAITRLALLPEDPAVDDLLAACSEVPADIQGQLFGDNGFIQQTLTQKFGHPQITLSRGDSPSTLSAAEFAPNAAWSTLDTWDGGSEIRVSIHDLRTMPKEESIELVLTINPAAASWANDSTITLPSDDVGVQVYVDDPAIDDSDARTTITGGTVHVVQAGKADGDELTFELSGVTLTREVYDSVLGNYAFAEVLRFNGSFDDIIATDFQPADGTMPFMDLSYQDYDQTLGTPQRDELMQLFEQCKAGVGLPFVLGKLDLVMDEVASLRTHLDAIASSSDASAFRWDVPLAAFANATTIPVGIAEASLLRGVIAAAQAANELLQQYNFFTDDFNSLVTTLDPYYEWSCYTICDPGCVTYDCPRSIVRRDLDPAVLATDLNAHFLAPASPPLTTEAFATQLRTAIGAFTTALTVTPTANVLLNFQASGAKEGSDELANALGVLLASMDTPQALTLTPEYQLKLVSYLSAPFDKASLESDTGLVGAMWKLVPRDDTVGSEANASVEPEGKVLEQILSTIFTLPSDPPSTIYCAQDVDCGEARYICNGHDNGAGRCYDTGSSTVTATVCTPGGGECGVNQYCEQSTCGARGPELFDSTKVDNTFNGNPPPFVNGTLWDKLAESL